MDILIAGAGICGLSAAIGLRQQGHRVTVFESGAAIFLPPNANGPLRAWGFYAERYGGNQYRGTKHFASDGKLDLTESFSGGEFWSQWDLIRRSRLHAGLKELAIGASGKGTPAKLITSSRVQSVNADADKPSLRLENGDEYVGDVVLGADGAHSLSRAAVFDANDSEARTRYEPSSSGKHCFRFLIEREKLLSDPITKDAYRENGHLVAWFGEHCHLVTYPCENDELINFVAIHPKRNAAADNNDYNSDGSYQDLRAAFADFEPRVQRILDLVDPTTIKLYPLLDMEYLPTYTRGKLALLGDAAHPFLPYLGQGGAQAIEDAVSITAMLPGETKPDQVSGRLKLYEKARKARVEEILRLTRLVGSGMSPDSELDFHGIRVSNYEYDEWKHSKQLLAAESVA